MMSNALPNQQDYQRVQFPSEQGRIGQLEESAPADGPTRRLPNLAWLVGDLIRPVKAATGNSPESPAEAYEPPVAMFTTAICE